MRARYVTILIVLITLLVVFEVAVVATPLSEQDWIDSAIQGAGMFVALLAAVVALHESDPKKRTVAVNIQPLVDQDNTVTHDKAVLPKEMLSSYQGLPNPFQSHRVLFQITNTSGFTLRQPTLTFRLPASKQHPHKLENGSWVRTFRSNIFNTLIDVRTLHFGDTTLLSNSNLQYWNDQEEITIWIRMVLGGGDIAPFEVCVSVNSENAEGITIRVPISLSEQ